jgi:hypothetical protein
MRSSLLYGEYSPRISPEQPLYYKKELASFDLAVCGHLIREGPSAWPSDLRVLPKPDNKHEKGRQRGQHRVDKQAARTATSEDEPGRNV